MCLWHQCIYCRITQEQTWVTCQFITADRALLQGLKMNSKGSEQDIYDWLSMFSNLSVNKCRSTVVTKQCFTFKCIHCSKNTRSNATKQNSVPYWQSWRHTKGTQKSFQNISQTYSSLNLTSKIIPKPKSTFKASNTFHKRFIMVQNIQWSSITKAYWCWMQLVSQKSFCAWLSLLKHYKEPCSVLWKWAEGE